MPLVYCREISGRGGSSAGLFETEISRSWRVRVSSKNDNIYAILGQLQIDGFLPLYLQPHPENIFATCRKMNVRDTDSGVVWTVTADYSTKPISQDDRERSQTPNPLDRRPRRWIERAEYDRAVNKDRDGNGLLTSAGTRYPEPAYIPGSDFILQVRQNVTAWPGWVEEYNNKLNENELTVRPTAVSSSRTIAEETALFKYLGCSEPQEENGVIYIEISYSLHIRPDGWQDSRLDEDLYYKDDSTLKRIQVDGEDAVTPIPLDGSGAVLSSPTPENVVFNDFDIIPVVDMEELSILNT